MNVIIKNNQFNFKKIIIKNNDKILYNFNNIQLLGISLLLKNFTYDLIDKYVKIKLCDSETINTIKDIDMFFDNKYKNYKKILESNNIIHVKNIMNKKIFNKSIYLNINSLKREDFILYLNIFTI